MKTFPPTAKAPLPNPSLRAYPPTDEGVTPRPAIPWHPAAVAPHLMSFEAVAKAIFVRSNGLPAYYKATGLTHRAD